MYAFDADKLHAFMNDDSAWCGMLRAKGFFWVAANDAVVYELAQAGGVSSIVPIGTWWASMPHEVWGHPDGERPDQQESWHEFYGDRSQTLVFIGQQLDVEGLRARLDACLLPESTRHDVQAWQALPNPFPKLELIEESEEAAGLPT